MVASNSGISGTTISLAKSLSRLTRPTMTTVRGSLPRLFMGVVEFKVMALACQRVYFNGPVPGRQKNSAVYTAPTFYKRRYEEIKQLYPADRNSATVKHFFENGSE